MKCIEGKIYVKARTDSINLDFIYDFNLGGHCFILRPGWHHLRMISIL